MLIEAGGLNGHADVTQSPAVFYGIFIFSGSLPSLFSLFRLFYCPCILSGQNRIQTGRIGRIDTQHFLQVRFYPAEKDQVMGEQVMQFRNLSHKNALMVKDIVQAPFLFLGIRRIREQIKAAGLDQKGVDIVPRMGVE